MHTKSNIENQNDESFRDHIATIDETGKRVWIYAHKPKGKLYNLRSYFSYFYLVLFFSLPFIHINGDPLFMFNVLERQFILFNVTFWPQDFFIFGLGMLTFILFIILFTVVFGRVFCGWACPQTIFLEMIFRKVEYWIEGDAPHQKALNSGPWNSEKILKKTIKNILFFIISLVIVNTLLMYVIGSDQWIKNVSEPLSAHIGGFITMIIFTGIFYGVYTRFREQVCLVVCPYGRLQGVLLDRDTIMVAYDYKRGEPRGKFNKKQDRGIGDCIDCKQCVKVCPVGMDIRNGTQLECINCTACIDACDHMMDSVGFEKGLIRYASENGIAKGQKLRLTPRIMAYSGVLTLLLGVLVFLLATRSDLDATLMRTPGQLFQEQPDNKVSNLYSIKMVNKTHQDMHLRLVVESMHGEIKMVGNKDLNAKKEGIGEGTFFIVLDKKDIRQRKTKLQLSIYNGDKKVKTVKTTFLGPVAQ